jgi:hypothetical protein
MIAQEKPRREERPDSLAQRHAFMQLPLEERRRRLAAQADRMVEHYEQASEKAGRDQWQGGDIVEL